MECGRDEEKREILLQSSKLMVLMKTHGPRTGEASALAKITNMRLTESHLRYKKM